MTKITTKINTFSSTRWKLRRIQCYAAAWSV